MTSDALSTQALNRALLARRRLLARAPLPAGPADGDGAAHVIRLVEHLAGLQAQAPFPPYYGLWSRLDGFRPYDLASFRGPCWPPDPRHLLRTSRVAIDLSAVSVVIATEDRNKSDYGLEEAA
jgi:hypothetical protein